MTRDELISVTERIWAVYDELATLVATVDELAIDDNVDDNVSVIANKSDNMP